MMNTLDTAPVAPLLERLFREAGERSPSSSPLLARMSAEERQRLMRSKTDYLEFYGDLKDLPLPVSRETGRLLYLLARNARARSIVEFGTSFGISTLHLAAALRDNGGGHLLTTEFESSKVALARRHLEEGGVQDLVEIRVGDALETLRSGLPDSIDLLLLDGAKALYSEVLALVEAQLRPGAVVVADNADFCPEYLDLVRASGGGWLSMPFGEDVELSVRL